MDFDIHILEDFFHQFKYEEGPVLGSGSFSTVVLATSKSDPRDVMAMKIFNFKERYGESESDENLERMVVTEVRLMKRMQHTNIMPIFSSIKTPKYLAISMPYCRGTLNDYIKVLSQEQQFKYVKQLCQGVDYLHNNKIIHGDIKPRNILINDDDNIWISDFGFAKSVPTFTIDMFTLRDKKPTVSQRAFSDEE
ncbi:Calmodulin-dependent protein kinase cmk1 [Bulinus truncatus]|nr:Calmodulin-dependent protein kinase cmk1 [Bulinus truncatus]